MARIFISHSSRDDEAAARMKAWLASHGFETAFLDFDKTSGIPPGADWEKTLYREVEQSQAVIIIQTPSWLASKWCFAEFTQARALGKAIFLVIETPTGDAQISPDIQTLNLLSDREGGLERLSRELVGIALDSQGGFEWDVSRPPFPGLLAFEEEDAAIYFGRDDGHPAPDRAARRAPRAGRRQADRAPGVVRIGQVLALAGRGRSAAEARRPQLDCHAADAAAAAPGRRTGGDASGGVRARRRLAQAEGRSLTSRSRARARRLRQRPARQGGRRRSADPDPDRPGGGAVRRRRSRRGQALS
jgi:hypothetical protein